MEATQVVEGFRAGRIIPQRFFVELRSLFIVLLDEHGVAFVVKRCWIVAIGSHGEVSISVSLVVVLLLEQMKDQRGSIYWQQGSTENVLRLILQLGDTADNKLLRC